MPTPIERRINDRSDRIEYFGKDIRLVGGSHLIPRSFTHFDHFTGATGTLASAIPQLYTTTQAGAGTLFVGAATNLSGLVVATDAGATNNAVELGMTNVAWKASTMAPNTPMVFECRAKFVAATTPADGDFYIGWANAVTFASSLPFVVSAASALTTSAPVEFAGIGYSSIPSSGALFNSGGNNFLGIFTEKSSVAATPLLATSAATGAGIAKDSNFHIYRTRLDASANADFYVDDVFVGSVAAATTAATAITPYIVEICKANHAQTATIDYIYVGAELV